MQDAAMWMHKSSKQKTQPEWLEPRAGGGGGGEKKTEKKITIWIFSGVLLSSNETKNFHLKVKRIAVDFINFQIYWG